MCTFCLESITNSTLVVASIGFPADCPSNCPCKKYDCSQKAPYQEKCGFSDGFCDMMNNRTNLPEYRMNWVRVYQDPNDELQKVGCSTPERPTRKYIEAHEDQYKTVSDVSLKRLCGSDKHLLYDRDCVLILSGLCSIGSSFATSEKWWRTVRSESGRNQTRGMWRFRTRNMHIQKSLLVLWKLDWSELSCSQRFWSDWIRLTGHDERHWL